MKLNKIFFGLIGMAALTMASCSSEDEYQWATVSGSQVFFSDELPSQYEIDPAGTSFNVPISRADASGSLTVNLTSTSENPMYSVPSSVTFDAGQTEAIIPVSYDATKIEYGRYDNITIKVADASQGTSWGIQEFTFKAGVTDWGPWQNWNSAGTASYIYSVYWEGEDPGLPFQYRHNTIHTNLYQFMISKWGSSSDPRDIVWEYDSETGIVSVPRQHVVNNSTYGEVTVLDYVAYSVLSESPVDGPTGYFDQEAGILACPVSYIIPDLRGFGSDWEYIYIDGYVRADYTSELLYSGIFTDVAGNVFAVGTLAGGPDVTVAKAVIVEADADASAVADAIVAGDIEAVDVEPGTIYVPIPESLTGKLQIVTAVIVDGEVKSVAAAPFEYYGGGKNPWKSLGKGYFTDNLFTTFFYEDEATEKVFDPQTYEVEILENEDEPGMYRLVNAFEQAAALIGYADYYEPTNIEVNATVADGVYILPQTVGLGDYGISTVGGRYLSSYDFATLYSYGYFGKNEDGVISFPTFESKNKETGEVEFTYQGYFHTNGKNYYTGDTGEFKIVLPGAKADVRAKARSAAKASDFARRLNGNLNIKSSAKKVSKLMMGLTLKDTILR